jgi:ATP-dependent helicase Lhr and Lhr-like helicase
LSRDAAIDVRNQLRRTWEPFLSRFGRPTDIQVAAVPTILTGSNIVVAAATASGKTETAVAPLVERLLGERWEPLSILYVIPTRALANDALIRVEGPMAEVGLKAALKHGDTPSFKARRPPDLLITTPESLDSLICRYPEALERLKAIILDEIHILDGTYRGDQLRVLMARLEQLGVSLREGIVLLSATLADPSEVAERYAPGCRVVVVPGQRTIEYDVVPDLAEAVRVAKGDRRHKILVFCNRIAAVEETADALAGLWRPYPVVAHYGPLDRSLRREAEETMREAPTAICVATSTLELGIDIGSIDLVILAEIPWTVSSLLQRVGRGNRRDAVTRAVGVAAGDQEQQILRAMFDAAIRGDIHHLRYAADPSVAVQQTLSFAFQHSNGVRIEDIVTILEPLVSANQAHEIVSHLQELDWLESHAGSLYPTTKLMDRAERGDIHVNIPGDAHHRVIDIDTGRPVGVVGGPVDDVFALGRKAWRVVSVSGGQVMVQRFAGPAAAPMFKRHSQVGRFYSLLPTSIRLQTEQLGSGA